MHWKEVKFEFSSCRYVSLCQIARFATWESMLFALLLIARHVTTHTFRSDSVRHPCFAAHILSPFYVFLFFFRLCNFFFLSQSIHR
jgi:hypothetical protein